jgi:hypothetical protein
MKSDLAVQAVASTRRPGADAEIGGFGGEVDLEQAGYAGGPIMVSFILIPFLDLRHLREMFALWEIHVSDLASMGSSP